MAQQTLTHIHSSSIKWFIIWRYKTSDTTHFTTILNVSIQCKLTVDCDDPSITVTESLGSCSASGAKTSTLSITNNESYTAYA